MPLVSLRLHVHAVLEIHGFPTTLVRVVALALCPHLPAYGARLFCGVQKLVEELRLPGTSLQCLPRIVLTGARI
jgi:hypothetical protein